MAGKNKPSSTKGNGKPSSPKTIKGGAGGSAKTRKGELLAASPAKNDRFTRLDFGNKSNPVTTMSHGGMASGGSTARVGVGDSALAKKLEASRKASGGGGFGLGGGKKSESPQKKARDSRAIARKAAQTRKARGK